MSKNTTKGVAPARPRAHLNPTPLDPETVARLNAFAQAHRERMQAAHRVAAMRVAIMQCGSLAPEPHRYLFCNHLLSLADLDSYERRGDFIAAFAAGGTLEARHREALALAKSGLITLDDLAFFNKQALARYDPWSEHGITPEIR